MANAWIEYIKKISKETGKSFKEAMSIASDRKKKGISMESMNPLASPAKKQRRTRKGKSAKKAKGTKKRRSSRKRR